jgi:chromosome segregation ATPase
MTSEEFQITILNELREFKRDTEKRFDSMDQRLDKVDQRLDSVEQRLGSVEHRLDSVEHRLDSVEHRLGSVEHRLDSVEENIIGMNRRLDIITEQTAGLLEFRTEVNQKLDQISNDQKSIMQVLGEHEVAIRTLQRRPV